MYDQRSMRPELFASPVFLCCVSLLVINDWILKPAYHNWLTGKLSDFAGLAALTLLGCAVLWQKRWLVAGLITLAFVYWKSPHSQGVIDFLNAASPLHISRTVDYSDLLALPVVWLACGLAPAMHGLSAHRWLQQALAILSVVALTATTIDRTHSVRESVDLALPRDVNVQVTEQELQAFVDSLAARYGLSCSPCEPLSSGRLYVGGHHSDLRYRYFEPSLLVRLDNQFGKFLYDIRSNDTNRPESSIKKLDSLKEELQAELRARFPRLHIESASLPRKYSVRLAVYKKKSLASDHGPENRHDYERAIALVSEVATQYGMKRYPDSRYGGLYYLGALLGPWPDDRELTIWFSLMGDSRLVFINVSRSSDEYTELQKAITDELAERLTTEFAVDRAGFR